VSQRVMNMGVVVSLVVSKSCAETGAPSALCWHAELGRSGVP
jgi:hypothetical protein